ncbi:MAG: DNA-processing protein DprA [Acidimicrobiales bacterium]
MRAAEQLPEAAFGAALASIPGIGPRRLRQLLAGRPADKAWRSVLQGCPEDASGEWRQKAQRVDVRSLWMTHRRHGIEVITVGDERYPEALAGDGEAPAVLFILGDVGVVDRYPRAAVVGTRSATRYGLGVAAHLGADLAAAGIVVLSGMALGIDGAGHEGAMAAWTSARSAAAPPVGVVAGGLDQPYPSSHARLWERVARAGALISESPVGCPTPRWRFPLRNRLLAALADVVVVVECHHRGGSLHTVHAADRRGVPVGAVPGSVRSPASSGTNDLLADGCFVVRDATDVLVAVGLKRAGDLPVRRRRVNTSGEQGLTFCAAASELGTQTGGLAIATVPGGAGSEPSGEGGSEMSTPDPALSDPGISAIDPVGRTVLETLGWEPCSLEELLRRTTLSLGEASQVLETLRDKGRVRESAGWWERC